MNKRKNKRKREPTEEELKAEAARNEFDGKWVSYKVLRERVAKQAMIKRLGKDAVLYYVLLFIWFLNIASQEHSLRDEASSKLALMETVVFPRFQSHLSIKAGGVPEEINFYGISDTSDFNLWLQDVLLPHVYHDREPAGDRTDVEQIYIQGRQALLWGVSIRQHRAVNSTSISHLTCCIPDVLLNSQDAAKECHPMWGNNGQNEMWGAPNVMKTDKYGSYGFTATSSNAEEPLPGRELGTYTGSSFPGGGYRVVLPLNYERAKTLVSDMVTSSFIDRDTKVATVTIQTYNSNINLFQKAILIVEFDATGAAIPVVHVSSSDKLSLLEIPPGYLIWEILLDITASIMSLAQLFRQLNKLMLYGCGKFEFFDALKLATSLVIFLLFVVNAVDYIGRHNQNKLLVHLVDPNDWYLLHMTNLELRQELQLIASIFLTMQAFVYLRFFSALSLVNGALQRSSVFFASVVLYGLVVLAIFAIAASLLFSSISEHYATSMESLATLTRTQIGTYTFHELHLKSGWGTQFFLVAFSWCVTNFILTLTTAMLVDGVQHQYNFEMLQRRGKPAEPWDKLVVWIKKVQSCLCYRHGCCRSPLCIHICRSVFSCRNCFRRVKKFVCHPCSTGNPMTIEEVLERIDDWKLETENEHVLFVDFGMVKTAMRGNHRNRRVVDDVEVAAVMTLCYVDPKLKGESFFVSSARKKEHEEAERAGTKVFEETESQEMKQLRSMKRMFTAIEDVSTTVSSRLEVLANNMKGMNELLAGNMQRLESFRGRLKEIQKREA